MTFGSCQGEKRDLIIYSMLANRGRDGLNYMFPTSLEDRRERIEDALKVQRLGVEASTAAVMRAIARAGTANSARTPRMTD